MNTKEVFNEHLPNQEGENNISSSILQEDTNAEGVSTSTSKSAPEGDVVSIKALNPEGVGKKTDLML